MQLVLAVPTPVGDLAEQALPFCLDRLRGRFGVSSPLIAEPAGGAGAESGVGFSLGIGLFIRAYLRGISAKE